MKKTLQENTKYIGEVDGCKITLYPALPGRSNSAPGARWFLVLEREDMCLYHPHRLIEPGLVAKLHSHGIDFNAIKWTSSEPALPTDGRYAEARRVYGVVYFFLAVGCDRVKIGMVSSDLYQRIEQVSTACPFPIRVLAVIDGDRTKEVEIQRRFAHLRCNGEWFKLTQELRDFIDAIPPLSFF